jgi:phage gpG-like protein
MKDKFNFGRVIENLKRVKNDLPRVLAADTKKYFVDSFNGEEWDGKKWEDVQRHKKKGGSSRNQSAILVQSGTLRRAVVNSLKKATWDSIEFRVSDVKYAKVHNEGLRAGRGAGFQMPKRTFMADTKELRKLQRNRIDQFIDKIWE